jgi:hypothetical protein
MIPEYDVDRDGWGARSTDFDVDDPTFLSGVDYVAVHWGGGTSQIPADSEDDRLRIWQRYHMDSRGYRDIAYNYAFGDSGLLYRCRGLNPGGHVKCSTDRDPEGRSYCLSSLGIVWVGGSNDPDGPSEAAYDALARFINSLPGVTVKGHRTIKQENQSNTACPGNDLLFWIANKGWENMANQETSNPAFQPAFDKALASGMFTEYTDVADVTTAEKFAVYLDRVGFFEALENDGVEPHTHTFTGETEVQ